jgi:hypothetical protein
MLRLPSLNPGNSIFSGDGIRKTGILLPQLYRSSVIHQECMADQPMHPPGDGQLLNDSMAQ